MKVVVAEAPGADAHAMRQLIDQLRKKASPMAVLLASRDDDKVTLVAGISRDLEAAGPERRRLDPRGRRSRRRPRRRQARHGPGRRQASGETAGSTRRGEGGDWKAASSKMTVAVGGPSDGPPCDFP